jgi:hypothetical protein
MGVKGCGFYRKGFMKEQRLVGGPFKCVVASLRQYLEKITTAWRCQ